MFRKGQSGNPAGRPKGTGKHQEFRRILEFKAPELLEKAISFEVDTDSGDDSDGMFLDAYRQRQLMFQWGNVNGTRKK